jgi:hypothetical protein
VEWGESDRWCGMAQPSYMRVPDQALVIQFDGLGVSGGVLCFSSPFSSSVFNEGIYVASLRCVAWLLR